MDIEWDSLDNAATANLQPWSLQEFFALKDSLHAKGVKWADAEMELVGYIWGAIEMDSIDDADIDDPN